jgi:hypothetical protein
MKFIRLSAVSTGQLYLQDIFLRILTLRMICVSLPFFNFYICWPNFTKLRMNVIPLESTLTNHRITNESKVNTRNCEEGATLNTCWTVQGSIPGKGKSSTHSLNVQTGSVAHLASYSVDNVVSSKQQSGRNVKVTSVLHLVTRLRISGTIPLLSLHFFMVRGRKTLPFPA